MNLSVKLIFILKKSRINDIAIQLILWNCISKVKNNSEEYWVNNGKFEGPYKSWQ